MSNYTTLKKVTQHIFITSFSNDVIIYLPFISFVEVQKKQIVENSALNSWIKALPPFLFWWRIFTT
jgi:hypothetical protein